MKTPFTPEQLEQALTAYETLVSVTVRDPRGATVTISALLAEGGEAENAVYATIKKILKEQT